MTKKKHPKYRKSLMILLGNIIKYFAGANVTLIFVCSLIAAIHWGYSLVPAIICLAQFSAYAE